MQGQMRFNQRIDIRRDGFHRCVVGIHPEYNGGKT
jgi:hypothetical protein